MDFGALPPEINSARMYAGPGAAPMMAAAAAWNGLGAELSTTASCYESVISALTGEEWLGPASASMAGAVEPYVAWMNSTATAAEHAAAQAMASAAAYEGAFAMTVPPPVIAANRARLAALVATNVLGQNTPAIAAAEALYGEMWAQDAAAMYGYAGSSASAGVLSPLTSPASATNPAGLSQLIAGLPTAVQGLASPLTGSAGLSGLNGFVLDVINATENIGIWNAAQTILGEAGNIAAWNLFAGVTTAIGATHAGNALAGAAAGGSGGAVLAGAVAPAGPAGFGGTAMLAGLGQASSVGGLSVPASWSAATPASSAATLTGTGWTAAAEDPPGATVAAGLPAVASAGRGGFGFGVPRYGFKPTVMPRPVIA